MFLMLHTNESQHEEVRNGKPRTADRGLCDLCRHDDPAPGLKLCPVCFEAIARLVCATEREAHSTNLRSDIEARSRTTYRYGVDGRALAS
jgi:hypothetical protein